jgi:IS1 family transposase
MGNMVPGNYRAAREALNTNPSPLIQMCSFNAGIQGILSIIRGSLQLVYSPGNPSIYVVGCVGELLRGIGLATGGATHLFSSPNLLSGRLDQLSGLNPSTDHFAPLLPRREGYDNGKQGHYPVSKTGVFPQPIDESLQLCFGFTLGAIGFLSVQFLAYYNLRNFNGWGAVIWGIIGLLLIIVGAYIVIHTPLRRRAKIVTQKHLTTRELCNTVIAIGRLNPMANVLSTDKQIGVVSALAEGSSIRSIERMTGVHRDTIMRLGVKIGQGCTALMDAKMRDLSCTRLELDEIWGFVGKKDRNVRLNEPRPVGNVWTFCAIDAETKLVPAFKVGDRDIATAKAFVGDVASRMRNRVQISTDGLRAYVEAIESAFGSEVDFAQIVKTYGHEEVNDNRRYSAPEFVSSEKKIITGNPNERLISTSYVERLNATTRLHMRRLTRLTLAFSKKRENFEAAVGLHFAYYNFVKRHNTLRCTPAMAAGVERDFWKCGRLG